MLFIYFFSAVHLDGFMNPFVQVLYATIHLDNTIEWYIYDDERNGIYTEPILSTK